jgi:membrane-associated protease RseP (regulator of RpoE activity)
MRTALLLVALAGLSAGEAPNQQPAPATAPAQRAYIGIAIDPAASAFDGGGLAILRVEPGSPAAVMGLAAGDRITSIDGKSVKNQDELAAIIAAKKPGDRIEVHANRAQGQGGLPEALKLSGILQAAPQTRTASLGNQLAELQQRLAELNAKNREPSLAEVLQRLQEIERDLPKAAEAFKKVYPNGEFRIAISVEITSDKTAKDPLNIEVGGKPPEAAKSDEPAKTSEP